MAKETEKVTEEKQASKDEFILVDKDGNETITTATFYKVKKEQFDLIGLTPKK